MNWSSQVLDSFVRVLTRPRFSYKVYPVDDFVRCIVHDGRTYKLQIQETLQTVWIYATEYKFDRTGDLVEPAYFHFTGSINKINPKSSRKLAIILANKIWNHEVYLIMHT